MNVGKMLSGGGERAVHRSSAHRPMPTNRNSAICTNTTMPLPMIARCASRRFFDDSRRCTMSWSAPCDAIDRNAPPMRPAQIVCGSVESSEKSMACELAGGAAPGRGWRSSRRRTDLAEDDERRDAAEQVDGRLEDLGPHDRPHAAAIRVDDREHAEHEDRDRHRPIGVEPGHRG